MAEVTVEEVEAAAPEAAVTVAEVLTAGAPAAEAVIPDCVLEEVGHICADLPGPGPGPGPGSGGGSAPVRPEPPTRIPESQFQTFDIPAPTIHAWPKDWAVIGKPAAFWTDADTSYIDMTLLTYAVTVKVTPEKYYWDFGDDTGGTTIEDRIETTSRRRTADRSRLSEDRNENCRHDRDVQRRILRGRWPYGCPSTVSHT